MHIANITAELCHSQKTNLYYGRYKVKMKVASTLINESVKVSIMNMLFVSTKK